MTTGKPDFLYVDEERPLILDTKYKRDKKRATYGKAQLADLSRKLTERFGKGWSVPNLKLMRQLFVVYLNSLNAVYPIADAGKSNASRESKRRTKGIKNVVLDSGNLGYPFRLSWSHYLVLMRIENPDERLFYEIDSSRGQHQVRKRSN